MVVAWIALDCATDGYKQGFKVFQIFGYFIKKVTRNISFKEISKKYITFAYDTGF
jgi:hypothetical protein